MHIESPAPTKEMLYLKYEKKYAQINCTAPKIQKTEFFEDRYDAFCSKILNHIYHNFLSYISYLCIRKLLAKSQTLSQNAILKLIFELSTRVLDESAKHFSTSKKFLVNFTRFLCDKVFIYVQA